MKTPESDNYEERQRLLAIARVAVAAIEESELEEGELLDKSPPRNSKKKPAPEFDPRIDYPERYSDGRPI